MNPEGMKAKVINRQMLTDAVIEFTIETYQQVNVLPGQWALFSFADNKGPFQRCYSIVDQDTDNEKTMLVFVIKLIEQGRGSTVLKNIHIGDEVVITGVFGHFTLQETAFPKVFIGTGVGLSPVLNMAKYCTTKKQLFFSVSHYQDLFYEERIRRIHDLSYEIHISQGNLPPALVDNPCYASGRIDFDKHTFLPDTEFYVCGRPEVANSIVEKLTSLGFKRIYAEKF